VPDSRLAIVIPTRNRSDLCLAAIESVNRQRHPSVQLVVSENSGPGDVRSNLLRALPRDVEILLPDSELAMTDHWEWALRETERRFNPTHISFLTDRMVFRDGALRSLLRAVADHPGEVISYNHDMVEDWDSSSVRINAYRGDGRLYRMGSHSILKDTAAGRFFQWPLPRMLNCVAPVELFAEMRAVAGHVFGSVSPDFYFGYRVLSQRETFLCLNQSLLVHRGLRRSNGHSIVTGVVSKDAEDFRGMVDFGTWQTPFPEVTTLGNAIFHEYAIVRALTGSDRFPPLDAEGVRSALLRDAELLVNADLASNIRQRLAAPPPSEPTRNIATRVVGVVRHPRESVGWHLFYRSIPRSLQRWVHRVFPKGRFGSPDEALVVARARPRTRVVRSHPRCADGLITSSVPVERKRRSLRSGAPTVRRHGRD
jgi:hypothetical protein